jgi:hypothetical protein
MDIPLLLRVVKAAIVALVLYLSLLFLGFPSGGSLVFALVPYICGSLNIMLPFSYMLTGVIFFIAATFALVPNISTMFQEAVNFIENTSPAEVGNDAEGLFEKELD